MNVPRLHHYVPQFYLRRFVDSSGWLWIWDRERDRVFSSGPRSIAVERDFYCVSNLADHGHDPLTMERQFAELEYEVARIAGQWLDWIRECELGAELPIPDTNRDLVSLFLGLQFLRTADTREILSAFYTTASNPDTTSKDDERRLHTDLPWHDDTVKRFASTIREATWVFGHDKSPRPFITSDNPVAFRTSDNRMWLKAGMLGGGTYLVYPVAPDVMMYCYPIAGVWEQVAMFNGHVSPVVFTNELVDTENSGQVFMASRFVVSSRDDFERERAFAQTIGTDTYATPDFTSSNRESPPIHDPDG